MKYPLLLLFCTLTILIAWPIVLLWTFSLTRADNYANRVIEFYGDLLS